MLRSGEMVYTLGELSEKLQWSKERIMRLLVTNKVRIHYTGEQGKRLVFRSDIAEGFPALYDSMRMREGEDEEG